MAPEQILAEFAANPKRGIERVGGRSGSQVSRPVDTPLEQSGPPSPSWFNVRTGRTGGDPDFGILGCEFDLIEHSTARVCHRNQ
jgi:hypothetical protein